MVLFVAIHYLSTGLRTLPQSKCAKNSLRYHEVDVTPKENKKELGDEKKEGQ